MSRRLCIAIDGPSGAGKSTLARALAQRLSLRYVDTGAIYRAVGMIARDAGVFEEGEVVTVLDGARLEVVCDPKSFAVFVDGCDVTAELRTPEAGRWASRIAAFPSVRERLVPMQRALARGGAVVEGRDIASVVLPDADFKFFVTADEAVRVSRRAAQFGSVASARVNEDVRERDRRDRARSISPLQPAQDAIKLDTSSEDVEESVESLLRFIGGSSGSGLVGL